MLIWRSPADVPTAWGRSAVAIGVFDGMHAGHRAIVGRTREVADATGARSVVISFDPHPTTVVRPDAAPLMLTSIAHRAELLESLGVDAVLVLPFTRELSQLSPEEFVEQILVDTLHASAVVVGANFRFGHKAAGDVALLRREGALHDFVVEPLDLLASPAASDRDPVSSTLVRALIADGDVSAAAEALGRPHQVEGPVVRGEGRGRGLGFPTANVDVAAAMAVPADGVYAGWLVRADGARLPAAVSIGTNPTFDGTERTVEAYALDVDIDLYDETVAIEFVQRLRGMVRFTSVEDLVAQMRIDVTDSRRVLGLPHHAL